MNTVPAAIYPVRYICRYLPPLVVLLPVIFICGKLLLTPVSAYVGFSDAEASPFLQSLAESDLTVRGWPWVYQAEVGDGFTEISRLVEPPQNLHSLGFSFGLLVADVACLATAMVAVVLALRWHYRRHAAWFKFSLRELFLLITGAALLLGWWTHNVTQWKQQQATAEELLGHNVSVPLDKYYYGPEWLRRLADQDVLEEFYYSEELYIDRATEENWGALQKKITKFPHVHRLSITRAPMSVTDWTPFRSIDSLQISVATDGTLVGIDKLAGLRELLLEDCGITSDSFAQIAKCSKLEKLFLKATGVGDENLGLLSRLPHLQVLDLTLTYVSDAGVAQLAAASSLRELSLEGTRAGDDCLEALQKLPHLEKLNLRFLPISEAAAQRLLAFPSLKSVVLPERSQLSKPTLERLKRRIAHVFVGPDEI